MDTRKKTKLCWHCHGTIPLNATHCAYCGEALDMKRAKTESSSYTQSLVERTSPSEHKYSAIGPTPPPPPSNTASRSFNPMTGVDNPLEAEMKEALKEPMSTQSAANKIRENNPTTQATPTQAIREELTSPFTGIREEKTLASLPMPLDLKREDPIAKSLDPGLDLDPEGVKSSIPQHTTTTPEPIQIPEYMSLLLFSFGMFIALFAFSLLFFSEEGYLTLKWRSSFWPLYALASGPILYVAWKTDETKENNLL